jgi:hypothetical protein
VCVCVLSTVSGFAFVLVNKSLLASLLRVCISRTPELSIPVSFYRPRPCFRLPGTHTKRRLRVVRPLCMYRWHPQFTARTARCSFLPAQPRLMCSTHLTPCFWPPGMCVCVCVCSVWAGVTTKSPILDQADQITTAWISKNSGVWDLPITTATGRLLCVRAGLCCALGVSCIFGQSLYAMSVLASPRYRLTSFMF